MGQAFGIQQCRLGHSMCASCCDAMSTATARKCPTCRVDIAQPIVNRDLQNIITALPANCKWPGCQQTGLTLGTLATHHGSCTHRLSTCCCGYTANNAAVQTHQAGCVPHHVNPLTAKVAQLQATLARVRKEREEHLEQRLLEFYGRTEAEQAMLTSRAEAAAAQAEAKAAKEAAKKAQQEADAAKEEARQAQLTAEAVRQVWRTTSDQPAPAPAPPTSSAVPFLSRLFG
jgi:F0F1-type ATP synthase epsilon subunit